VRGREGGREGGREKLALMEAAEEERAVSFFTFISL